MKSTRFKQLASKLWTAKATIYAKVESSDDVFDDVTDKVIVKNTPCKVVVKKITPVTDEKGVGETQYTATLLISPDITIPAGSVIDVTDEHDHTTHYKRGNSYTGYSNHQEVALIHDEKATKGVQ